MNAVDWKYMYYNSNGFYLEPRVGNKLSNCKEQNSFKNKKYLCTFIMYLRIKIK